MPSEDDMSIEELVDRITIDAYGDEGCSAFLQARREHLERARGDVATRRAKVWT